MSERHYRLLRYLWLGVFYAMVGVELVLASLGWQRHATTLTWLGLSILVTVGATWPILFQPQLPGKRSRPAGRRP